jgi:hypothetical protein
VPVDRVDWHQPLLEKRLKVIKLMNKVNVLTLVLAGRQIAQLRLQVIKIFIVAAIPPVSLTIMYELIVTQQSWNLRGAGLSRSRPTEIGSIGDFYIYLCCSLGATLLVRKIFPETAKELGIYGRNSVLSLFTRLTLVIGACGIVVAASSGCVIFAFSFAIFRIQGYVVSTTWVDVAVAVAGLGLCGLATSLLGAASGLFFRSVWAAWASLFVIFWLSVVQLPLLIAVVWPDPPSVVANWLPAFLPTAGFDIASPQPSMRDGASRHLNFHPYLGYAFLTAQWLFAMSLALLVACRRTRSKAQPGL